LKLLKAMLLRMSRDQALQALDVFLLLSFQDDPEISQVIMPVGIFDEFVEPVNRVEASGELLNHVMVMVGEGSGAACGFWIGRDAHGRAV
jgi:hypothetical protein